MYLIWRLRGRKTRDPNLPPRWGLLFGYACLAGVSHILLDFTNNYGVRPFWPFSERWYSWDIVFIVEPVILVFLVLGLILPGLTALINDEIGSRPKGPQGRVAAILALLSVMACWWVRDFEHRRAVTALAARTYQGADPLRVSAYPYWVNPFRWYGVAETPTGFAMMNVNSLAPEVDPEGRMQIRYKPEETPTTLAAKKTYLGRVYLDWAQYPVTETEQIDGGSAAYIVRFRDLRFSYPDRRARGALGAWVALSRNLEVVDESFGARRSENQAVGGR
jgi:inner membrane protein